VSVNLALALQQRGARVGLVDADILGPSIPGMLGIPTAEPPAMTLENRMIPAERHGLKVASDVSWTGLKAAIGAAIRAHTLSGMPSILGTAASSGTPARSDAELGAAVQELLDREVNRSIASHGGKISLVDVCDRRLFITMSGGCQGCASPQVTLRQGFEVMVKRMAPETTGIVDATDHAAGRQPFYPQAAAGTPLAT